MDSQGRYLCLLAYLILSVPLACSGNAGGDGNAADVADSGDTTVDDATQDIDGHRTDADTERECISEGLAADLAVEHITVDWQEETNSGDPLINGLFVARNDGDAGADEFECTAHARASDGAQTDSTLVEDYAESPDAGGSLQLSYVLGGFELDQQVDIEVTCYATNELCTTLDDNRWTGTLEPAR